MRLKPRSGRAWPPVILAVLSAMPVLKGASLPATAFAPLCAVALAGYYLLRRRFGAVPSMLAAVAWILAVASLGTSGSLLLAAGALALGYAWSVRHLLDWGARGANHTRRGPLALLVLGGLIALDVAWLVQVMAQGARVS